MNDRSIARRVCALCVALVVGLMCTIPVAANETLTGRYRIPVRVYTRDGVLLGAGGYASMTFPVYEGLVPGYFLANDIQQITVPTAFTIENKSYTIERNSDVRLYDAYNDLIETLWSGIDNRGNECVIERMEEQNRYTITYHVRTAMDHNLRDPYLWLAEQARFKQTSGGDLVYGFEVRVTLAVTAADVVDAITGNGEKLDAILEAVTDTTQSDEAAGNLPNALDLIDTATLPGADQSVIRDLADLASTELQTIPETFAWIDESGDTSNFYIWLIVPAAFAAFFDIIFHLKRHLID